MEMARFSWPGFRADYALSSAAALGERGCYERAPPLREVDLSLSHRDQFRDRAGRVSRTGVCGESLVTERDRRPAAGPRQSPAAPGRPGGMLADGRRAPTPGVPRDDDRSLQVAGAD